MHKRIVRFSTWVSFLIARFTHIVSFRATDTRGKEREKEGQGAPLKPHFRRIDFQVRENSNRSYATRRFNFTHDIGIIDFFSDRFFHFVINYFYALIFMYFFRVTINTRTNLMDIK